MSKFFNKYLSDDYEERIEAFHNDTEPTYVREHTAGKLAFYEEEV